MLEGKFVLYSSLLSYSGTIYVQLLEDKNTRCMLKFKCPPFVFNTTLNEVGVRFNRTIVTDNINITIDENAVDSGIYTGVISVKDVGEGKFKIEKKITDVIMLDNDLKYLKSCQIL